MSAESPGVAGIAIPFLGLLIVPIWTFPDTSATGAELVAFVREHRAGLQATMVLNTLGVTLWLAFGSALRDRLRRQVPASSLPAVIGAAVTAFCSLLLAGFVCFDVLVYRPTGAESAHLLYDLTFGLLAMSGLPTAIALSAYAVLARQARLLGSSTVVLAAAAALAHLALLFSFIVPTGFFALQGQVITVIPALLWAWILATAIALLRSAEPVHRHV